MPFIEKYLDEEIRIMSAEEIVRDCLPGNHIPTPEQANEIVDEIVRALKLKWGLPATVSNDELTTDQLIAYLEETGQGCGLVSDDFGHWAVCCTGTQNIPEQAPADIVTTFHVQKGEWKKTIREALLDYLNSN